VVIPRDALLRYPDGTFSVFLVRSVEDRHTAHEQRVSVGRGDGEVEILQGLSAGDRVVTRGNETLRDGQAVEVRAGG
jgi:multidrug efflux pump subunit AcrA (membrane-fusion protein)